MDNEKLELTDLLSLLFDEKEVEQIISYIKGE